MNGQKITFFLPGKKKYPVGGYKVVYEYANKFAMNNYSVNIIYTHTRIPKMHENIFFTIKRMLGFFYRFMCNDYKTKWFNLEKEVKEIFIPRFEDKYLKKYKDSFFVATAVSTAYELTEAKVIPGNHKYYLIQDFEMWRGKSKEYVLNSYKLPLKKIVISSWLEKQVISVGEKCTLIPNGFDFDYFKLINPIESRKPSVVAMLYHEDNRKRCSDSFNALWIVKQQISDLRVLIFGTSERPADLPSWYKYFQCPDKKTHNEIYNNAAIFVAASEQEGFALPPAESMICGCALCCTDIGGFHAYAKHNETALLSPVYDVYALATNILQLIRNDDLRIQMARNGNEYIKQFTWDNAFYTFKNLISSKKEISQL